MSFASAPYVLESARRLEAVDRFRAAHPWGRHIRDWDLERASRRMRAKTLARMARRERQIARFAAGMHDRHRFPDVSIDCVLGTLVVATWSRAS